MVSSYFIDRTYSEWSAERISRHLLYWLAWLVFYATTNSSMSDYTVGQWMLVELFIMLVKLPFTYTVLYLLVPRFLYQQEYGRFFIWSLTAALIGGVLIKWMAFYFLDPYILGVAAPPSKPAVYRMIDLIYIASLPAAFKLFQRQVRQEKETLELTQQKLGAELKLLRNQLQPHFLFNTLNNLYGMVLSHHPKAADVVVRLSEMMSYLLYESEQQTIDLEKEIEHLAHYLELERIRYGDRLELTFDTKGGTAGLKITPLLLLPFVENAFKHGVHPTDGRAWIHILLRADAQQLLFQVENSVPPDDHLDGDLYIRTESGIGLANVRKRLALLYSNRYELTIQAKEDSHLVVLNLIP